MQLVELTDNVRVACIISNLNTQIKYILWCM